MSGRTNLQFEDLQEGMMVTVTRGKKVRYNSGGILSGGEMVETRDTSYNGDVLEVIHIEYPFVNFKNHSSNYATDIQLDMTEEYQFMEVSERFIKLNT
jgi:hypothetical protein